MKFSVLLLFLTVSVFGQDTIDNGVTPVEIPHKKNKKPRQQQQQAFGCYARKVVRGNDAELLFLKYSATTLRDLSEICSEPVQRSSSGGRSPDYCFDRGATFSRGSRYKCYVQTKSEVNCCVASLFDFFHNSCGGNGVHPLRQH